MLYNFKKNIIKNENNSYTFTIMLPKSYTKLNYKIYNSKNIIQSGFFENSSIIKHINVDIDKLDIIFILMNFNSNEYFELVNLKNYYNRVLENIKISFIKNKLNLNGFINDDDDDDDYDDNDNDDDDNDNDENDSSDEDGSIINEDNNNLLNNDDTDDNEECISDINLLKINKSSNMKKEYDNNNIIEHIEQSNF